jgi:hypothetical protein
MAASQQYHVCDNSSYANFASWASAISAFLASAGWLQATDTGQVMWSGMSITAVSVNGTTATYSYSGLTGLALAVGRSLTITGMQNAANDGVFRITALGSGIFSVTNAAAVAESGSSGAVTQQSAAPGSGAYFYEIWQPGDALQPFYMKVEYGNASGSANSPALRITLSTGTNGAGTATGYSISSATCGTGYTAPSSTVPYECNLSATSSRVSIMMWRNAPNGAQQIFAVQRSLNSSGIEVSNNNKVSNYVSLWTAGVPSGNGASASQYTLHFNYGPTPGFQGANNVSNKGGWPTRNQGGNGGSLAFAAQIAIDFLQPCLGVWDYPCTVLGVCSSSDVTEGIPFSLTNQYGQTRTYMPSRNGAFGNATYTNYASYTTCMEWD